MAHPLKAWLGGHFLGLFGQKQPVLPHMSHMQPWNRDRPTAHSSCPTGCTLILPLKRALGALLSAALCFRSFLFCCSWPSLKKEMENMLYLSHLVFSACFLARGGLKVKSLTVLTSICPVGDSFGGRTLWKMCLFLIYLIPDRFR